MPRRGRRALTLIETLISMVLAGLLIGLLVQGTVQMRLAMERQKQQAYTTLEQQAHIRLLQGMLRHLIAVGDTPCLEWDGAILRCRCLRGSHPEPPLSGPCITTLAVVSDGLMATIQPDPDLWGELDRQESKLLWPGVMSMSIRAFGTDSEGNTTWQDGMQTWTTLPRYLIVLITTNEAGRTQQYEIPIFTQPLQ